MSQSEKLYMSQPNFIASQLKTCTKKKYKPVNTGKWAMIIKQETWIQADDLHKFIVWNNST